MSSFMNISGWWVDTHASRVGIETRIRLSCEVGVVEYGKDLAPDLGATPTRKLCAEGRLRMPWDRLSTAF